MTKIAMLGAGGKMGCRLTDNLRKSEHCHELFLVEPLQLQQQTS